jgi:AcrR family transcriptional regulator
MSKKEKVLKAATELFARQGFNKTATSEIAQRAGVAQGTVFHHFKSKENLLVSICDELIGEYIEGMKNAADAVHEGTGWEALERILLFNREFRKKRYESIVVATRETRMLEEEDRSIHEYFCGLMGQVIQIKSRCIEKGIADGSIREVPPHITALLIHIMLSGIVHVEAQGVLTLPDLDLEVIEFCRRSLCPEDETVNEQTSVAGG